MILRWLQLMFDRYTRYSVAKSGEYFALMIKQPLPNGKHYWKRISQHATHRDAITARNKHRITR